MVDNHLIADVENATVELSDTITATRLVGGHIAIEKDIDGRRAEVFLSEEHLERALSLPKEENNE